MLSICAGIIGLGLLSVVSAVGICLTALVLEIFNYTYVAKKIYHHTKIVIIIYGQILKNGLKIISHIRINC